MLFHVMNLCSKWQKVILAAAIFLSVFLSCAAKTTQFETAVKPLPNEDIASDCHYELAIPAPSRAVRAVWVIFDRGDDVHDLFGDIAVRAFARRFRLALLLHGHCPGKAQEDHGDMNVEPSEGLGRALLTALDQFAHETGHRELSSAKLIFLGFSGAGPLSARLVNFVPDRALAAILSSPGHFEPVGIDTVNLKTEALVTPELILTGSADSISGTARPYGYFQKYRKLGAPWAFVVQNKSPHCCTANAKGLMLRWLEAVIKQRLPNSPSEPLRRMNQFNGWQLFLKTRETGIKDSFGLRTFEVAEARVQKSNLPIPKDTIAAGWLPNHALAQEWVSFVQQRQHPILPLR